MKKISLLLLVILTACSTKKTNIVVFQSDFGLKNNAVSAMLGVAATVDPTLTMYNLTHDIPNYDIWSGALSLAGVIEYWPKGTVFVSVVDPGVGTARYSVVAKTKSGHYITTPDNGTLTFVAEKIGITEMREIDEVVNRRADSEKSYTFHGRDVYAYTAARLASGEITFEQVGKKLDPKPVMLDYTPAQKVGDNIFEGTVNLIDAPYGNIWSNIPRKLFLSEGIETGDMISVTISSKGTPVYQGTLPYVDTFGVVAEGQALLYVNSEYQVSLALNMGDFASTYDIRQGFDITVKKVNP